MDKIETASDRPDSMVIKKNAKGDYAWDLKIYFDSKDEKEDAIARVKALSDKLNKTYDLE